MDYVIAGLGSGAVLAIIGFFLMELGLSSRRGFPRWMPDSGAALMFAALIIWIVTAAAFFSGLDDDAALRVVAGSAVVATAGSVIAAAVMTRAHRPAAIPARAGASAQPARTGVSVQAVENTNSVNAGDAASESALTGAGQPTTESDTESVVQADGEKNWPEIWRQTWGSGAAPAVDADPVEEPDAAAAPVSEDVLESWGEAPGGDATPDPETQVEVTGETGDTALPMQPGDELPLEQVAEDSGDTAGAPPESTALDDADADRTESELKATNTGEVAQSDRSLNGKAPAADHETPESEVELTDSRARDQV